MTHDYVLQPGDARRIAPSGDAACARARDSLPGLAEPHSQLAVPIGHGGRLLGVLFVESLQDLRFTYDDEDALVGVAAHLAVAMRRSCRPARRPADEPARRRRRTPRTRRRPARRCACATTTTTAASSSTTTT